MEIYLVGGAVRDQLLGLPVKERDWVVVGATPDEMKNLGFRQVGRDFPVFLHPQTHEEYALARTERKSRPGYHGFVVHAEPDVSLEDDLRRRDLTINALAEDAQGKLIDPFGGLADLESQVLRHVSPAFAEDPVRILRVARLSARLAPLGFRVAEETLSLMSEMVESGEVDALVPERVWQELVRALAEDAPSRFFSVLRECGAQARLFPEIDRLFGVPQSPESHPEIDTGVHTLMVLDQSVRLSSDPAVRFAALTHDLGKGTTPPEDWPRHPGHEERSERLVLELCRRLKTPNHFRDLACLTARFHGQVHAALELEPAGILEMLEHADAFRRPERFEQMLLACEADHRGREGFEETPYPQAARFRSALERSARIDVRGLIRKGLDGRAMATAVRDLRLKAIEASTG